MVPRRVYTCKLVLGSFLRTQISMARFVSKSDLQAHSPEGGPGSRCPVSSPELGQGSRLQDRYFTLTPSQYFPPLAGVGLLHCLRANCTPPPQVREQGPYASHLAQEPSTCVEEQIILQQAQVPHPAPHLRKLPVKALSSQPSSLE